MRGGGAVKCGNCDAELVQREWSGRTYPSCPACKCLWPKAETLALVHKHRRPTPTGTVLSLTFEPNGTGHTDVLLRLGAWAHRSDSYYYELDHRPDEPADEVQAIRELLRGWLAAVESCGDGEEVFLPHAFFDQCSGWLRCTRCGNAFQVVDGWSNIEGWSIYPSDYADKAEAMSDYRADDDFGDPVVLTRTKLQGDIQASINALEPATECRQDGQP